jgi:hypothetical protein
MDLDSRETRETAPELEVRHAKQVAGNGKQIAERHTEAPVGSAVQARRFRVRGS